LKTGTAINYKLQSTVGRYLRDCGIFNEHLLQIHCWVCLWKNFYSAPHYTYGNVRQFRPSVRPSHAGILCQNDGT